MPGQQQSVPLHQPVDALGVDWGQTVGSPLALEERGDPPVPVGRSRVDKAADSGCHFKIAVTGLRSAFRTRALDPLGDVRARQAERIGDLLHREPSEGTELDSEWARNGVILRMSSSGNQ